jgi:flagellar biosynthesis protein
MKKAVALSYNENLPAPMIVAGGRGELAEKIEQIARENGIHIEKDGSLAESLIELEVGSLIPEWLYEVVAELLAYIYKAQAEK